MMPVSTTKADVRECLAEQLEGTAEWHESKAEPDRTECSRQATAALRACADYVRNLPSTDERLVFLDSVSLGEPGRFVFFDTLDTLDAIEERRLWVLMGYGYDLSPSHHLDSIVAFYESTQTLKALIDRVNRKLRGNKQHVRVVHPPKGVLNVKRYHVVSRGRFIERDVDLLKLAQQLGVLHPERRYESHSRREWAMRLYGMRTEPAHRRSLRLLEGGKLEAFDRAH